MGCWRGVHDRLEVQTEVAKAHDLGILLAAEGRAHLSDVGENDFIRGCRPIEVNSSEAIEEGVELRCAPDGEGAELSPAELLVVAMLESLDGPSRPPFAYHGDRDSLPGGLGGFPGLLTRRFDQFAEVEVLLRFSRDLRKVASSSSARRGAGYIDL